MSKFFNRAQSLYDRLGGVLFCLSVFLLPLKLSWCLGAFFPLVILWIIDCSKEISSVGDLIRTKHIYPLYMFIALSLFTSIFGLDFLRSLDGLSSLTFYSLIILIGCRQFGNTGILSPLLSLLAGQTIAGFHSIITRALDIHLPDFLPGPVTESGQLALVFILAIGLGFYLREGVENNSKIFPVFPVSRFLIPVSIFLIFGAATMADRSLPDPYRPLLLLAGCTLVTAVLIEAWRMKGFWGIEKFALFVILEVVIPVLLLTLIINLKRGPWLGVFFGSLILFSMFSRRLILPITLAALSLSLFLPQVHERLISSYDHFSIAGGRKAIWEIGTELTLQYPLGIGLKNSQVLRNFSTEIPPQLKHFHNNFLNIAVETGWLGLSLFLWWIAAVIYRAWGAGAGSREAILARTIACALISWQLAGSVEYNFGDSEVILIAFFLISLLTFLVVPRKAVN